MIDPAEAVAPLRQHDLEPLEVYPGCQVSWRVLCLKCNRDTTKHWNDVKSGVPGCKYCANRAVTAPEAVVSMRAVGLEPLGPYPGSNAKWMARHTVCQEVVNPTFHSVMTEGAICPHCTMSGFKPALPAEVYLMHSKQHTDRYVRRASYIGVGGPSFLKPPEQNSLDSAMAFSITGNQ